MQQFAYDSSDDTLIITEIAYYSQGNYNYRFFMKIALNGDNIAGSARVATEGNSPLNSGPELIAAYEIAPNVHASMTYNFIKGTSFDSELGYVEEAGGVNGLRGTGGAQGSVTQSIDLWNDNHPTYGPSGVMLFNNSITTGQWHGAATSANETEFVTFQFPTAKTIARYRMWFGNNTVWEAYPWQVWLYGSNDNSTFTLLHNADTSTGWVSTTNAADIGNGVNCKTFDIPANVQGSYTYYKTQMQTKFQATGSGNHHTNLHEIVFYSNSTIFIF